MFFCWFAAALIGELAEALRGSAPFQLFKLNSPKVIAMPLPFATWQRVDGKLRSVLPPLIARKFSLGLNELQVSLHEYIAGLTPTFTNEGPCFI